jgi:hypothetical protein
MTTHLNGTLETLILELGEIATLAREKTSFGLKLRARPLPNWFEIRAIMEEVWSSAERLTEALFQLQSWMATNGYASGLQVKKILFTSDVGALLILEVMDSTVELHQSILKLSRTY